MNTPPAHIARGKSAGSDDLIIARRHRVVSALEPAAAGTLLDFGCGNGAQTILFAPRFEKTLAVDVDEPSLNQFAAVLANGGEARVLPACYDGRALPLGKESVDFAVSFEVLEHVHDEMLALRELHRVLRPGATLALSVPNRWWIFETHGAALPLLPWNRVPFFSWLPKPIHDRWARARIYSRGDIVARVGAAGFVVRHAVYVTAPMDVLRNARLQWLLRSLVFRGDCTRIPFFSTAVLVIASRR